MRFAFLIATKELTFLTDVVLQRFRKPMRVVGTCYGID
jgi:hypothetical protein